jgi:mannose-6-phosphate isomerase-like protein (cupin superfamily)
VPFVHTDDFSWNEPPGHIGGYSRYLVNPDNVGSTAFDYRISRYPVGGKVDPHTHEVAEHVYHFLAGTGTARCGDEVRDVGPGDVLFVPAGAVHSVVSTGDGELQFIVVTSPPSDIAR